MATKQQRASCGRDVHCVSDLNASLDETMKAGYDFICVPLVHPRFKRETVEGPAKNREGALTRSDLLLSSSDWSTLIVAKVSPWLQLESSDEAVRKNSEKSFKQELMLASHLSVPAILVALKSASCINMARIVTEHILQGHNHQFWVQVPMVAPEDQCSGVIQEDDQETMDVNHISDTRSNDTWHWWNTLRTLCDSNKKIGLVLELSADLPPADVIDRWCGEPVKALVLPTSVFVANKKGFPVLSRAHQLAVKKFFKLPVQLILSGCVAADQQKIYLQYMEHLWQSQDPMDNIALFAKGYEDFLQCPLQPLMDNLESQTYEVFEKDPIKYSQYQLAIYQAILERVPHENRNTQTVIVMVLGAGRGPLVSATLQAAESAERKIRVYAVEKNPNAVITLENLKADTWGETVTIVSGDMRVWEAPEKADIIISELLGSFGDNELSPECLDGAQRFLKEDSVSIPCSYTSYVCPLSSSKLWNEARVCRDPTKTAESYFETPYVVRVHNSQLLDKPQPLFTFTHPTPAAKMPTDNNRFGRLQFDIGIDTVLHGFGGYFYCVLYGDVTLSIVPDKHTAGMFSWFPMYFPIKEPVYLRRGEKLVTHFWRINNGKNVWYEWCITEPTVRPIHNPKGRSYTIGL